MVVLERSIRSRYTPRLMRRGRLSSSRIFRLASLGVVIDSGPHDVGGAAMSELARVPANIGGVRALMGDQFDKIGEMDAGAFRALFATFFPKVQAMLMRQGADAHTAEEIAQDTMLAVWRNTHQFSNNRGSVSAWIYAIARNLRIDRVRKNAVWQRLYAELEMIEWLDGEAIHAQPGVGERHELETALRGLPPQQLEVIQLSFIDGLSQSRDCRTTRIAARHRQITHAAGLRKIALVGRARSMTPITIRCRRR